MKLLPVIKNQWEPFQNITLNVKLLRKTLQERRLPILKFSQDKRENNFLNFLNSKNIFITYENLINCYKIFITGISLEHFWNRHLWNIPRIFWKHYFVVTNLPKIQHLLLSNHTLLAQKLFFHLELFKKPFPLKCLLNVPWMFWTLQRSGKTQRIFSEYYIQAGLNMSFVFLSFVRLLFDTYLFQLIVILKPDFNCSSSFALSWIDKVSTGI